MQVKNNNQDPQLWLEQGDYGEVELHAIGTDGQSWHLMTFLSSGHYELAGEINEGVGFALSSGYLAEIDDE